MELEHRFEVPVGIDSAWPSLLDMSQVADCFPGATLSSADGDTYIGSVKVKLGPIQLTYQGKARIVEADESAHRAVIEASGSASRSASTASMTVTATATALDDDHTAVNMATSLTITGRPAQFGRGVMVEVGNKILGQFADCLSGKLAASVAPAGVSAASAASGSATAAATAANPAASVAQRGCRVWGRRRSGCRRGSRESCRHRGPGLRVGPGRWGCRPTGLTRWASSRTGLGRWVRCRSGRVLRPHRRDRIVGFGVRPSCHGTDRFRPGARRSAARRVLHPLSGADRSLGVGRSVDPQTGGAADRDDHPADRGTRNHQRPRSHRRLR